MQPDFQTLQIDLICPVNRPTTAANWIGIFRHDDTGIQHLRRLVQHRVEIMSLSSMSVPLPDQEDLCGTRLAAYGHPSNVDDRYSFDASPFLQNISVGTSVKSCHAEKMRLPLVVMISGRRGTGQVQHSFKQHLLASRSVSTGLYQIRLITSRYVDLATSGRACWLG